MTNASYDEVIEAVRRLTAEEQQRLRDELATPKADQLRPDNRSTSSLVAFLQTMEPIRPEALDAMECAIEEDCEGIDSRDW
jgi:hypothetical protein